jgi:glycosyltransferase involved in cell wall biosynthesis
MNERTLVSVVIPARHGEKHIRQALETALQQDYDPFEIIAVDDGSTDHTREIILSYPGIRCIHQNHQGVASARNNGVQVSKGDFIAFLDQDDIWRKDKLRLQVECLRENPNCGYVLSYAQATVEEGTKKTPGFTRRKIFDVSRVWYIPSTLLVRKSVFHQIGPFDIRLKFGSDSDWFFRAHDAGIEVCVVSESLVHKRFHDNNDSYKTHEIREEILRLVRASISRKQSSQSN